MTKIKFTKASSKDGDNVVTVNTRNWNVRKGDEICLTIKARWSNKKYQVWFTCNRKDGSTAKTTEWPKRFAKPEVGSPVEYEVLDAELLGVE